MTTNAPDLIEPFWPALPKNFTLEQQKHAYNAIIFDARFPGVVANLPNSEVEQLIHLYEKSENGDDFEQKKLQLQCSIVLNRLMNRICNACFNKSATEKLLVCSKCNMTFYCNQNCQQKDWNSHQKWCCKQDAAPDDGPMKSVVMKLK